MLQDLLNTVQERLRKKKARARSAYIREHTTKATQNCVHRGRVITDGIRVCKIGCIGESEEKAGQCWNEKATWCPEFQLKRPVHVLVSEFDAMTEEEISLRWPSIGELIWLQNEIQRLIQLDEKIKTPDVKAG